MKISNYVFYPFALLFQIIVSIIILIGAAIAGLIIIPSCLIMFAFDLIKSCIPNK